MNQNLLNTLEYLDNPLSSIEDYKSPEEDTEPQLLPQQQTCARFLLEAPPTKKVLIWYGSAGQGKSEGSISTGLRFMSNWENAQAAIVGYSRETVNANLGEYINKWSTILGYPDPNVSLNTNSFKLGSNTIRIVGANNVKALSKIKGATFSWILVDEVDQLPTEEVFEMLLSRLRKRHSKMVCTMNATFPLHWIYENWILKCKEKNISLLTSDFGSNYLLDPSYSEFLLTSYDGPMKARMIDNMFVSSAGTIYPKYTKIPRDRLPKGPPQSVFLCVDPGSENPFAASWILKWPQSTKYFVVEEYYYRPRYDGGHRFYDEHIQAIKTIQEDNSIIPHWITGIYCDRSNKEIMELLTKHFKRPSGYENSLESGIQCVALALKNENLLILDSLKWTAKELGSYMRGKDDQPIQQNDHLMDGIRYFCQAKLPIKGKRGVISRHVR